MAGIALKEFSPASLGYSFLLNSLTPGWPPEIIVIKEGTEDKKINEGSPKEKSLKDL